MNPTLEKAARAAREYMESVNADEHTAEVLTLGVARAVPVALLDEADSAGETEYRFIQSILGEGQ